MKPIVLRRDEVRALLDKGEAVAVREMKPQPTEYDEKMRSTVAFLLAAIFGREPTPEDAKLLEPAPPHGRPGEQRWVKETYWQSARSTQSPCGEYEHYWGDTIEYFEQRDKPGWYNGDQYGKGWMCKRPSVHMLQKHSRLTVTVRAVTVEQRDGVWYWAVTLERNRA